MKYEKELFEAEEMLKFHVDAFRISKYIASSARREIKNHLEIADEMGIELSDMPPIVFAHAIYGESSTVLRTFDRHEKDIDVILEREAKKHTTHDFY